MKFLKSTFSILILVLVANTSKIFAQQEAQYTQYMYNTLSINPAYAGTRDVLSVVGLHRTQWVGMTGAPRTQTLSIHSPVGMSQKIGLGANVMSDQLGPTNEVTVTADASYRLELSRDTSLRFGLKAGFNRIGADLSDVNYQVQENTVKVVDGNFNPVIGAGVFLNTSNSYIGLSVPNFIQADAYSLRNTTVSAFTQRLHAYLIAGHVFDITDNLKLKPAILSKFVIGSPLQLDFSLNAMILNRFIVGGAYRYNAAYSVLLGCQINDSLMFGLSYDKEPTDLGDTQFNDGTYEVMLRFELFKAYGRITTPRFF